jgi:NAD(P)H-dependent flavin oxidoreductase YrpB (nitropropane dioxygenase family)
MKGSLKFNESDPSTLDGFLEYCGLCGWALALAHAKSGDPAMIAGYCGNSETLDEAIGKFAMAYAKQTDEDYDALDKARRTGRIKVAAPEMVN